MITLQHDANRTRLKGLDDLQRKRLSNLLSFPDQKQEYASLKLGYPTPYIHLLDKDSIPSGLITYVTRFFDNQEWSYQISDRTQPVTPTPIDLPDWLYPHQPLAIKAAWANPRGIICSPTGSGKTTIAAFYLKAFPQQRLLVSVPTLDLLKQTVTSLERLLEEPIGQLSGKKREWQRITVGVINTLYERRAEFKAELDQLDAVVIDECHRTPVNRYKGLLAACPRAFRRLGLSATPYRGSGEDLITEGLLGPMIYRVTEEEVTQSGLILEPTVVFIPVADPKLEYEKNSTRVGKRLVYNTFNGKPERDEVYNKALVLNSDRNRLIANLALAFNKSACPGSLVVIVTHIEQGQAIQALLQQSGLEAPFIYGGAGSKAQKEEREAVIKAMKEERLRVVVASSILNEGVDIPPLRVVINAGGGAAERTVLQQLGRVVRTHPGKKTALYIDFEDQEQWYLSRNVHDRKRAILKRFPNSIKQLSSSNVLKLLVELKA